MFNFVISLPMFTVWTSHSFECLCMFNLWRDALKRLSENSLLFGTDRLNLLDQKLSFRNSHSEWVTQSFSLAHWTDSGHCSFGAKIFYDHHFFLFALSIESIVRVQVIKKKKTARFFFRRRWTVQLTMCWRLQLEFNLKPTNRVTCSKQV